MLNDSLHFRDATDFLLLQTSPGDYSTRGERRCVLTSIASDEVDALLMKIDAPTCFVASHRSVDPAMPEPPSEGDGDDDPLRKVDGPVVLIHSHNRH
jgi:hypothetical protein